MSTYFDRLLGCDVTSVLERAAEQEKDVQIEQYSLPHMSSINAGAHVPAAIESGYKVSMKDGGFRDTAYRQVSVEPLSQYPTRFNAMKDDVLADLVDTVESYDVDYEVRE